MREDVPFKKLGDVCTITGGGTPSKKRDDFYGGNIPWATVRDMNYDVLEETDHRITVLGLENSSANIIPKDNVVIATRVGLGKVCKLKQDTAINQDLKGIIPKNDDLITDYLFLWFKSISDKIIGAGTGATVQGVKIPFVKNLKIPIPPLPEQKRVVEILDEAFEAIDQARANVERNIQNAEELFQSKLNEIFSQRGDGWGKKSLGDLTYVKSGGTPKRSTKDYWENGSIPWYSSGELNELFTTESDDLITEMGLKESNAKLFPKGSLLIGMYDTAALKMSILDRDGTFNQAIAGVKPTNELNLQFVMHAINAIKQELMKQRRGVRQKNLNLTKIKAIPIPFPKIEIQDEVVAHLSELQEYTNALTNTYNDKAKDLDELKKSILQKAFSGELTANEHVAV